MIVLRAILPYGPAHPSMIRTTWRVPFTKSAIRTNSSGACWRFCMLPIPAVITGILSGREKAQIGLLPPAVGMSEIGLP